MPDPLADFLDASVAAALRKCARGLGGTVRLPSQRWKSGGSTGAVLTAVFVALPGPDGRPMDRKWIVKILPAGMEQEPGRQPEQQDQVLCPLAAGKGGQPADPAGGRAGCCISGGHTILRVG